MRLPSRRATVAALSTCLALLALAPQLRAAANEEKQNHPDGTLQLKVGLDSKGEWHGQYTTYWPGGKRVRERSQFDHGKQHGTREVYDDKGNKLAEETWVKGRLVFPKSTQMIEDARKRLLREAAASVQKMGTVPNPDAPSMETLARALAKVNSYRYLCDVPADVVLDPEYINLCQHASELLVKVGSLTHNPTKPAGYDDKAFELGRDGCGRSNLFMGGDSVASVDAYMNDSDQSNIDRIGHRRWVINPRMAKTGFGQSGKFSAMYSFDGSRENVPSYDFVCFPPRGYCPTNMFSASYAWHVSVNPSKYTVGDNAKLAIYPIDARLNRAAQPLELNYQHVDRGGFGINNAIIARPKSLVMNKNAAYEVVVTGVTDKQGKEAEISYFVSFY